MPAGDARLSLEGSARRGVALVLPDVPALGRAFDYEVPEALDARVREGTIVRVPLHGRRVRGWVLARDRRPQTTRPLQPVARVVGWGPAPDLVELARWAAWRWAGSQVAFLRAASPLTAVPQLPRPPAPVAGPPRSPAPGAPAGPVDAHPGSSPHPSPDPLAADAFGHPLAVVRLPPDHDVLPFALEAAARGDGLVLLPSLSAAAYLAARLRRAGLRVALLPDDWAAAAAGGCVAVGSRRAAWAPRPDLGAVLVVDEHDETYQEERAPTWNARDVAVERARRAGVPCVLTSPCPSLEALASGPLLTVARAAERAGWPVLEVLDRREDAQRGLYSERLVALVREAGPGRRVVCVLNRKGRARLLACAACSELTRCEVCGSAVETVEEGLRCRRCGEVRPVVCAHCGSSRLRVVKVGVSRVREELEHLAGRPVDELTAEAGPGPPPSAPVIVGTEAVLHRLAGAHAVAFLDFDQELMAPRYRAAEQAMALLARAARIVGPRGAGGRILVQTRLPAHEAIDAALHADPARLAVVESARRAALGFPPERALALVAGTGAAEFVSALGPGPDLPAPDLPAPDLPGPDLPAADLEVLGPAGDRWLVLAPDHRRLADALAATPRPKPRLRVSVDPLRA